MPENTEVEVLERLVPDLVAEGYEVFLHPNRQLLPKFLGRYSPDAIARRADKNLAIEVLRKSPQSSKQLEQITALFRDQEKWELRVYWLSPTGEQDGLQVQKPKAIRARITEIRELAGEGHFEPALLLAWATFEALARVVVAEKFERPQTPGRLVETLASDGYLTPTEADELRSLADKRNKLIHGELQVRVSKEEIESFATVLDALIRQAGRSLSKQA